MPLFKVADRMPQHKVDALIVLSYCLAKEDPSRLTVASTECMSEAIRLFVQGLADQLFITAAGTCAEREKGLKLHLAESAGVNTQNIGVLMPVNNTYDEARMAALAFKDKGVKSLILVAEARHMPRSLRIFQRALPSTRLYCRSVRSTYESEYYGKEGNGFVAVIRALRGKNLIIRLLLEWTLNILHPFLMRKVR